MKFFIKKYKYIFVLLLTIIIVSYFCYKNYYIIENFTCSNQLINPIILTSDSSFKKNNVINQKNGNDINYYTLSTSNNNLNCFSSTYDLENITNNPLISDSNSINFNPDSLSTPSFEEVYSFEEVLNLCTNYANENIDDFFTVDSNGTCYSYKFNNGTLNNSDKNYNNFIYVNTPTNISQLSDLANINNCNINQQVDSSNITALGYGGFTNNGKYNLTNNNISESITYYNPICVDEYNINNIFTEISNNTCTTVNCSGEITDIKELQKDIINRINVGDFIGQMNGHDGSYVDLSYVFNTPGTILYNTYNSLDSSLSTYLGIDTSDIDMSYNIYNKEVDKERAIEKESNLNNISTYTQYILLIIVVIISIIMFILNITSPNIITPEILTGYLIFIVLVLFFTSKYFNVNYGIFNKFFSLQLGNSGSRNIFSDSNNRSSLVGIEMAN